MYLWKHWFISLNYTVTDKNRLQVLAGHVTDSDDNNCWTNMSQ